VTVSKIVFFLLVALSVPILASIVNSLVGGRRRSAWMTLRVYLILVALYATFLLATTLALPIQVFSAYEAQYSDDWSIAVTSIRRVPHDLDEDYEVDFRMANHGAKPMNGEKNLAAYVLTEDGTRYNASPEPNDPPFDALVKPGKFVSTTRKFVLPTNQNRVELVLVHQGFRLGWFLVGRFPFDGRTVILLQK